MLMVPLSSLPPSLLLPSSLIWALLLYFFCRFCVLYWWSATSERKNWIEFSLRTVFFPSLLPSLRSSFRKLADLFLFNENKNAASYRLRHRKKKINIRRAVVCLCVCAALILLRYFGSFIYSSHFWNEIFLSQTSLPSLKARRIVACIINIMKCRHQISDKDLRLWPCQIRRTTHVSIFFIHVILFSFSFSSMIIRNYV